VRARDLFLLELFRRYRAYAIADADRWYILSAKHGLLDPDQVIAPYECTLNAMSAQELRDSATRVQPQLQKSRLQISAFLGNAPLTAINVCCLPQACRRVG